MAFLCDLSAAELRKFMLNQESIVCIEAFPERDDEKKRVFQSAKMSVCILGSQKNIGDLDRKFKLRINDDRFVNSSYDYTYISSNDIKCIDGASNTIPLVNQTELSILLKMCQNSKRLKEYSKCYTGEIDLSLDKKYVRSENTFHMRTTFTITDHRDVVENKMSNFLCKKHPKITFDTVKCIFRTMIDLLSRRQGYELLSKDESFDNVKKNKGFERADFERVIDEAILITIPEFLQVEKLLKPSDDMRKNASLAWVTIAADSNMTNNQSFLELFRLAQNEIRLSPYEGNNSIWDYTHYIKENMIRKNPLLCAPYDELYIPVLVTCLLINETRRTS